MGEGTYDVERFEKRFLKSVDICISGSKMKPDVTIRANASNLYIRIIRNEVKLRR